MKKNLIILGLIIILTIAIFIYVNFNPYSNKGSGNNCPEEIKLDRLILVCSENSPTIQNGEVIDFGCAYATNNDVNGGNYAPIIYKWKDGQDIDANQIRFIIRGQEEGQNINYLYMKHPLTYKKEIEEVDENGVIIEHKIIVYEVWFIFDMNDRTDWGYKILNYSCSLKS